MIYPNPQKAYKAGYALKDPIANTVGVIIMRHVNEAGVGTVFFIPDDTALELDIVVRSTGHGDIYGAPLDEVNAAATSKEAMQ